MSIKIENGEDLAANKWVPGGYIMSLDDDLIEIISEMNFFGHENIIIGT